MCTRFVWKALGSVVLAALLVGAAACDDDGGDGVTPTDAGDVAADQAVQDQVTEDPTTDPGAPDVTTDQGGPDQVADPAVDPVTDVQVDLGPGACAADIAAGTVTEALRDNIEAAIAACGRSQFHCLTCGLGTASACGGVEDTNSPFYVDCTDPMVPDEECTLSRCVERCIAENDFGDCANQSDCDALLATVQPTTCTGGTCQNDAATVVSGSSLSAGCLACSTGVTQCISDSGNPSSCINPGCPCDKYRCDSGCEDGFEACSGLESRIDCAALPAVCPE